MPVLSLLFRGLAFYHSKYNEENFQTNTFVAFRPFRTDNYSYLFLRCYAGIRE